MTRPFQVPKALSMKTSNYRIGSFLCVLALTLFGCSAKTDSKHQSGAEVASVQARPFDPTVRRTAKPSKSLTMAPDWQPPTPSRTQAASILRRVKPSKHWGAPTRNVGAHPSDAELRAVSFMLEPLRPIPGTSTEAETDALAFALRVEWAGERKIQALDHFLDAYPTSRWAPVLHLNLGKLSYEKGYFQDALTHFRAGWELAKMGDDRVSQSIANLSLAESAKMNARIGRVSELEALLEEAQKRTLMGDARTKITSASEGAWMMRHRPGDSFRCGPYAVLNVAKEQNVDLAKRTAFLEKVQSPLSGFSIPEVQQMSAGLGMKLQIAKRDVGAPVIVPAVVHWKVGHFAAVTREANGQFLLQDPTFGNDLWISASALDREASGYFLVPEAPLPSGWSRATVAETAQLYGKGYTGHVADATGGYEHKVGGCPQGQGGVALPMATYRFHTLAASLHVEDTPIGYSAAYGPDVRVQVAYNQREAGQPTAIDFTSFGPQFVNNWVSYAREGSWIDLVSGGGGTVVVQSIPIPGVFPGNRQTGQILTKPTSNTFKLTYPDGRVDFYEHAVGNPADGPQRIFMSRKVDPQGNEATIEYDSSGSYPARIHQIVDATGLATVFHYDYPSEPYLVTSIEDPFGRSATFAYDLIAGEVRLQSTEDPFGIVSVFTYDAAGQMVSMTTPYGTTTFNLSEPYIHGGENLIRYIEATDPLGQTERVEYNIGPNNGVPSSLESPQPSSAVIGFSSSLTNYRNTFYWDKLLMKLAPGDHQKARLYHWLHQDANTVIGILESEREPLEGRVFYNYPGQPTPYNMGSLGFPSAVGRVVKDASGANQTAATQFTYNTQANATSITDPLGRQTVIDYTTDGIDVVAVKQKTGTSSFVTMASATYGGVAPPHRPATVTDGAGQVTSFTYSFSGQVLTITNAKSEVTTFAYETNTSSPAFGRLNSVTGDVAGGNRTFTYDAYGRVQTTTDSEGYTLTYDYDILDRLRTVTYPNGSVEQLEYADHSLVATKDREGRWTRHMYNPLMQRVVTQDPTLRTTQFEWCRCGDLKRFVDGNGSITQWERDVGSRVTKKINADATFETFTYELSGRLSTAVDAMARTVTYKYANDDALTKKDYSDTATPDVTYAYDAVYPRLTSRVDGTGTTTFSYVAYGASTNGAGQVSLVNGPLADDTQKHTYDQLGRLKKLQIVDDATQTTASYSEEYTFDARSRVTTVVNNLGSSTLAFVGQSSRPSSVTYANGMQAQYDYNNAAADFTLKQIKNVTSGGTPTVISQFDYTYRPDRSIETWKEDQGSGVKTWTYGYDGARQLTKAERRDASNVLLDSLYYSYDKAGNRTQTGSGAAAPNNYETNNLNQIKSARDFGRTTFAGFVDEPSTVKVNGKAAKVTSTDGGAPFTFEALVDLDAGANTVVVEAKDGHNNTSTKTYGVATTGTSEKYEYDLNGNLRYKKQPNGTVIREYRWDQQNRLVRVLEGTHESVYEYDGASRRTRIKELTSSVETKNETFVWCGSRICQKRASNGTTVTRSYFGNGFEEGSTDRFYTRDHLGSVREVVASDGTTIGARLSYDPWGKLTESGSVLSDFTYTGHHFDRPTQLNLAHYRGYDPALGRWLSEDPIGLGGGLNLYRYVNDNPINYVDPTGRNAVVVGAEVGFFAGLVAYEVVTPIASMSWGGFFTAGLEGAVTGAAFGAHPYAGIAAVGALGVASDKDLWKFGIAAPVARSVSPLGDAKVDCRAASQASIEELGEGQLIEMLPVKGEKLPNGWGFHVAHELPSGAIYDPKLSASFASEAAWRQHIAGDAPVLISRSPHPPPAFPNRVEVFDP